MDRKTFEQECYDAYALDWMMSHGWSLGDAYSIIVQLAAERVEEDPYNIPSTGDEVRNLADVAREHFLYDEGFGSGNMYACKSEFLGHEFMDEGYMAGLLSRVPDGGKKMAYWRSLAIEAA